MFMSTRFLLTLYKVVGIFKEAREQNLFNDNYSQDLHELINNYGVGRNKSKYRLDQQLCATVSQLKELSHLTYM